LLHRQYLRRALVRDTAEPKQKAGRRGFQQWYAGKKKEEEKGEGREHERTIRKKDESNQKDKMEKRAVVAMKFQRKSLYAHLSLLHARPLFIFYMYTPP